MHKARPAQRSLAVPWLPDASMFERSGIGWDLFCPDWVEYHGNINTIKAWIRFADVLTTASETYANEIMTSSRGRGLEVLIQV
ncbi:MAG: glycogen/starch synthase, partial [Polyangiaceae bacterium]|nr:glycogen/starch synthase [Polyangiaceae bacterium]